MSANEAVSDPPGPDPDTGTSTGTTAGTHADARAARGEPAAMLDLVDHGPDTFVGRPGAYTWGNPMLFGGQVVAQALAAASMTVTPYRPVHSLHSYFIRPGSRDEPIRFEVERLRDGRSFATRQVVARQSQGAILNMSASFQSVETEADRQVAAFPDGLPDPDDPSLVDRSWGPLHRRMVLRDGDRVGYWLRVHGPFGDRAFDPVCAFTFMTDAAPTIAAKLQHPIASGAADLREPFLGASLDHAVWFHRQIDPREWHWFDLQSHGLAGARGLVTGDVLDRSGVHVATIAQEILLRVRRPA